MLKGSGVGGEVEAVELDVVGDGHSNAIDSKRAKRLHVGQVGCGGQVRLLEAVEATRAYLD